MSTKRRIFIPSAITILLVIGFVVAWTCISRNDYVFKINGQKVSMNEFNSYFKLQKKSMENELGTDVWNRLIKDAPAIETARDAAKQSLVDTVVKVQQAKARKLSLLKEEREEIRTIAEDERIIAMLDNLGLSKEEFIKINEDSELIGKLAVVLYKESDHSQHTHGKVDISAYENNKESDSGITTFSSRHILFSTKDKTPDEEAKIKEKAEGVLKRVLNGESFASLASSYSEDLGSKDNGGLYENIERGAFVPEYETAVLAIKEGEVYPELVKSVHGYHIIKSEGVTNPEGCVSLQIAQSILASELNSEAAKWIESSKIEVNEQRYNLAQ